MNRKQLLIVFGIVVVVLAVIIVLLATGGSTPAESSEDAAGDVVVQEGENPPTETDLADILDAPISEEDGQIVLSATMATEIPEDMGTQGMDWKWEIYEGGATTWIVSANLDVGQNATVFSPSSGVSYSTIDDGLPGELTIDGATISIALNTAEIDGFPTSFTWKLTTKLDGAKGEAGSATADDFAPDLGFGEFPLPE